MRGLQRVVRWTDCETVGGVSKKKVQTEDSFEPARDRWESRRVEQTYHGGVLLLVRGGHDFDAAVYGHNNLFVGERD